MKPEPDFFPEKSRQFIILAMIGGLFLFLVYSVNIFIPAFLGALIFYVLFRKFMRRLIEKNKWKHWLAALLIIFFSFLVIVIPLSSLLYLLFGKVQIILTNQQDVILGYHTLINKLNGIFDREIVNSKTVSDFSKSLAAKVPSILNSALQIFASLLMMYFLLYYLLINIGKVESSFFSYLQSIIRCHYEITYFIYLIRFPKL